MTTKRTILVTGSTDGLGRQVAQTLAGPDVHLIIHGRDAARGKAVLDSVTRAGATARFYQADFARLCDVRGMARQVMADHPHLDVLVNNAGIAKPWGPRQESADGYELHFAVNYLAPFLLTNLLLPMFRAYLPSRIVNVVSAGQARIDFNDLMSVRGYDGLTAYGRSKVAGIMWTFDLAEALMMQRPALVNCLHPGTNMDTAMVRDAGIAPATPVEAGVDALLPLIDAPAGTTGRYFNGKSRARAHEQAYDLDARRKLRAMSLRMTGLDAIAQRVLEYG